MHLQFWCHGFDSFFCFVLSVAGCAHLPALTQEREADLQPHENEMDSLLLNSSWSNTNISFAIGDFASVLKHIKNSF